MILDKRYDDIGCAGFPAGAVRSLVGLAAMRRRWRERHPGPLACCAR
jgi:hypothetical protein